MEVVISVAIQLLFLYELEAEYAFLIVASTAIDYYSGMRMSAITDKKKRRPFPDAKASLLTSVYCYSLSILIFSMSLPEQSLIPFNIFYNVPEFNMFLL